MHTSRRTQTLSDATSVPGRSRVWEVDVLRGFALLGILLVNVQIMAGQQVGPEGELVVSQSDKVVEWLVTALISAKFYLMFSFLFGYSFTLQRASAERAGAPFAPRHLRRLICLFLLGLAHGVLLFSGDVLMVYAVLSLVLFWVRDSAARTLVRAAIWLIVGASACLLAWGMSTVRFAEPLGPQDISSTVNASVAAWRGDPGSVVGAHLRVLHDTLGWNVVYSADMLAALLLGLAAGRRRILADSFRYRAWLTQIVICCLPIGLAGSVFMAICRNGPLDARWYDVGSAVGVLTAPFLSVVYVCGLLLLLRTGLGRRVGCALAPAGRMALTNYLTQSLVMALVFTGYGLAWYGRFGMTVLLLGCFALYAAQLTLSSHLLRHVPYGPAEWLLRTATLARRP
ncbi:DUF418 domain-containing protein [Streptomyces sp. NBC_00286]|uniref:DUF418 domain-containing protein n=1 Tax=Streptomyces sp. NBC_00286 TaxID=2975701 RepID=UPI002E2C3E59|nr:DUF418 domain-containing protein [Streptomyces sp. NBC_00286]